MKKIIFMIGLCILMIGCTPNSKQEEVYYMTDIEYWEQCYSSNECREMYNLTKKNMLDLYSKELDNLDVNRCYDNLECNNCFIHQETTFCKFCDNISEGLHITFE